MIRYDYILIEPFYVTLYTYATSMAWHPRRL